MNVAVGRPSRLGLLSDNLGSLISLARTVPTTYRAQSDALLIESHAKRWLADE